jgi:hypothetical protein
MNKRLEELLERVATWPPGAQEDAVTTLEVIEASVNVDMRLTPEEQEAKLAALRELIRKSIDEGGNLTDEEVEAGISAALDARERDRKSA